MSMVSESSKLQECARRADLTWWSAPLVHEDAIFLCPLARPFVSLGSRCFLLLPRLPTTLISTVRCKQMTKDYDGEGRAESYDRRRSAPCFSVALFPSRWRAAGARGGGIFGVITLSSSVKLTIQARLATITESGESTEELVASTLNIQFWRMAMTNILKGRQGCSRTQSCHGDRHPLKGTRPLAEQRRSRVMQAVSDQFDARCLLLDDATMTDFTSCADHLRFFP